MTIYKFRITFEDYDDIVREIEVKPTQTFLELHEAIHQNIGFKSDYPSSFYMSNDQWLKLREITNTLTDRKKAQGAAEMSKARICDFIEDPHQKIYYIFDFDKPWTFQIELIAISEGKAGIEYPILTKKTGDAPKQFGMKGVPIIPSPHHDDHDFLNETEYAIDDPAEMEDLGLDAEEGEESEEESDDLSDEISDEFSDNEGFEGASDDDRY